MLLAIASLMFFILLIWWLFLAPDELTQPVAKAFSFAISATHDALADIGRVVAVIVHVAYIFGRIATAVILLGSLSVFINEMLIVLGYSAVVGGDVYERWLALLSKPYAWGSATAIVAATVAVAGMLKYELEFEKSLRRDRNAKHPGAST
jgi:hypothetical protein